VRREFVLYDEEARLTAVQVNQVAIRNVSDARPGANPLLNLEVNSVLAEKLSTDLQDRRLKVGFRVKREGVERPALRPMQLMLRIFSLWTKGATCDPNPSPAGQRAAISLATVRESPMPIPLRRRNPASDA
jgi:hypothetical protein